MSRIGSIEAQQLLQPWQLCREKGELHIALVMNALTESIPGSGF